jgi:ADP-heptose:LPS heptosyltransferase
MAKSDAGPILVIKLGALGDFILAFPAFQAIRQHHPNAAITLLTTAPFAEVATQSGWFDRVIVDEKPRRNPLAWLRLVRALNDGNYSRVYDLQTSGRSGLYYRLFRQKPEWSGIAKGCSHPDPTPVRGAIHAADLRVNQLKAAGIDEVPAADFGWFTNGHRLQPAGKTVLLVPGASPHRPAKRWPAERYAGLAARLQAQGLVPVVIGGPGDSDAARTIASAAPATVDLTGQTNLADIADLARDAVAAIGNDTGPMHIVAAVGCPSLVMFSAESRPHHSSPRGRDVRVLQRDDLRELSVEEVEAALKLSS